MNDDPATFRTAACGDDTLDGKVAGATAAFPFDRLTVERFRAAFPQARWREDLGAWFVPGTTAMRRLATWQSREWSTVLAYADQRGRDAYAFDRLESPYLEPGDDLVIRTPYSRTVIDELRAVPWSHWDSAARVWRVPYRSWEELRRRWPAIETAAKHAEPEQRRLRTTQRAPTDNAKRALAAEHRRYRYPVPDDAMPPTGRVTMTHLGCVVFEEITGELAEPDTVSRFYPDLHLGDATALWATWSKPTHAELVKAWPARHATEHAALQRGWWQPDLQTLRAERRKAASLERAQATRRERRGDAVPSQPASRSET